MEKTSSTIETSSEDSPLLEVRQVCKRYPGVLALDGVNLQLYHNELLAVIGENGAGKSTLMKILAGIQQPDEGDILLNNNSIELDSVQAAQKAGIALIHQELNLAGNLSIAANIFLGREFQTLGFMHLRSMEKEADKLLKRVGLNLSPRTLVDSLSVGQQQLVEIAKALAVNAHILIMDEPTSSLSQHETEKLFQVISELKASGVSIIYISHRLGEVYALADRVTVLRDGKSVGDLAKKEIDHDTMVRKMVGRDISQFYDRTPHPTGEVVLEARGIVTPSHPTQKLNLTLRSGEIVGLAGLVGAGRTELLRVLTGVDQPMSGSLSVHQKEVQFRHPRHSIDQGIMLVPEDRKDAGLVLAMNIRENLSLPGLRIHRIAKSLINWKVEKDTSTTMIDRLRIKTPAATQLAQFLSGGNQQKIVLGKWLALGPRILLLDEPTRGIDIGAKEEIYQLMDQLAKDGVAILFASSEMEEVIGMSDRVLVMHEGRLAGELPKEQLTEEKIMQLATGVKSSSST
ncbi:Ribose import ATP-binding protein RbsA [Planctomycetales bacterium 10988]|nr:Ribose import ATP-binding protein RbsA [Planctomycetales bacterium 10988]